ncbi:MAG: hypothetical protein RLZZ390_124 [Bacteroidota bacterium]
MANKWYVDELYDAIIIKPLDRLAAFLGSVVDNKIIDGLVNGVGKAVQFSGHFDHDDLNYIILHFPIVLEIINNHINYVRSVR